eukprot:GSChrysophyteH2.ASY1.ANO1.1190.1 assembled CDS
MVYCWKSDDSETWEKVKEFLQSVNYGCIKETTKWFMETASLSIRLSVDDVMMVMTIFVLFADNIKLMTADKSVDEDFVLVNAICLFAFILELVLNTWSKTTVKSFFPFQYDGYLLTFFWVLDVIAILSMLPDIYWIAEPIGLGGISGSVSSTNKLSKAGRVVRLVRLVRLVKLYKIASERELKFEEVVKAREAMNLRQSRLGEQLSESTTQRVVILVLLMVCVLPLLESPQVNYGPSFATRFLQEFNVNSDAAGQQIILDTYANDLKEKGGFDYLMYLKFTNANNIDPVQVNDKSQLSGLRDTAVEEFAYTDGTYSTTAIFSYKWLEYDNAAASLGTTTFIAVLLVVGSLVFTADTQTMVIAPIERMMNMVEAVARDPLKPLSFDHHRDAGTGEYETRLLETTIEKITGLLRVGFGEAGAGIISANLQVQTDSRVRIYAVIGFCDIHHFEEINRLLTNDVLVFVNTIAEIVHSRVHYWGGQCNKNLGNAFVILWRIGDELDVQLQSQGGVDLRRVPGVDKLADHALVGYLKIIAEINRNTTILSYRNEPRLTKNGTKEYKVTMGFGLHAGWAIEGAVGSIHKVDATYLSPHVNMAARLETSSRQYGVPILISQNAYDLFSNETQHLCRRCDVVTVKGSEVPIGVFTYDALQDQMFPKTKIQRIEEGEEVHELCPEEEEAIERRLQRFAALNMIPPPYDEDNSDEEFDDTLYNSHELFNIDTDLKILRTHATDQKFLDTFKAGVDDYLEGNWSSGRIKLKQADQMMAKLAPALGGDGPCATLLDYMEEFGPDAPDWWKGYRPLTAK